jgi:hypothetical protein
MSVGGNRDQNGRSASCPLSPDGDRTADIAIGPVRAIILARHMLYLVRNSSFVPQMEQALLICTFPGAWTSFPNTGAGEFINIQFFPGGRRAKCSAAFSICRTTPAYRTPGRTRHTVDPLAGWQSVSNSAHRSFHSHVSHQTILLASRKFLSTISAELCRRRLYRSSKSPSSSSSALGGIGVARGT